MSTIAPESACVQLQTNDGEIHTVSIRCALQMCPVRNMILLERQQNMYTNDVIPLSRVDAKNLRFIIKWWTSVQDLKENVGTMGKKQLIQLLTEENASHEFLLQVILAANYLQMEDLLQATTHLLADALNECESVEEIRKKFFCNAD
ncbi:E3 ubiquitin ligase complex SCF subunit scon-3 [Drosophila teissieri]|uniref:E3 ubiquitin ligase complex SCF subunit scon-3 n=1 Tax=Drosophila teissieri TaxID=7243 RepID=UPI001CBA3877|nr:E3 ubiquitin ligase complex SCF subunit scon-3 [Drosophila teissieri]XP_043650073.1 E3 ubiquitin ligase complex SCF subunit scon-3 [Drosophila teissieri]